jgi:hypothetical protein
MLGFGFFGWSGKGSLWRGKLYSLEAISQVKRVRYGEEAFIEGGARELSNDFFIIMRTFLAGPEKTPAKMDGTALVSFKDHAEYIFFVEKKLKGESLVVDLVCFPGWEACYLHWIVNNYPGFGIGFKGNFFHGQ